MFNISKYLTRTNKLVIGEKKNETDDVAIEGFSRFKSERYSILIDNRQNKKAKLHNKNIVTTISNNEYVYVLLINKFTRHLMTRTQSKDYRIRTYIINKISLSFFNGKIYIRNNRYDGLISSWLLEIILKKQLS